MIDQLTYSVLEFPKVLQFISVYCTTENGKVQSLKAIPFQSYEKAIQEGEYVNEAKRILNEVGDPPIDYLPNLTEELLLSKVENSVLPAQKINQILKLSQISRFFKEFFRSNNDIAPTLSEIATNLFSDKQFEKSISQIIDDNDEIKETASKKLSEIRKEIREKSDELNRLANRIVKKLSDDGFVRENYITLREGRIVIPIKAEHKRHIRGFIHSESSSGQTVYIEPEETLNLNNDIISLNFAEKREIERLLKILTSKIGLNATFLLTSYNVVTSFDVVFAKARYSISILGSFPTINHNEPVNIIDARHPVLLKKFGKEKTVPFNIRLKEKKIIIISGPNAGGKTVLIKSLGLLSLLVQSGIHIPCNSDSNFHFFNNILVDIGDQQSIEDDLSTFSSHLIKIKQILSLADKDSLVLLDELGTGTDPAAGTAIASAILLSLREKGATVLSTTHLGDLKLLASDQEGFENAMMEFDTVELKPAYKFAQGVPGSSYAFDIAKRIGFDKKFLEIAQNYFAEEKNNFENILRDIEDKSQKLRKELFSAEAENRRVKLLAESYTNKIEEFEKKKRERLEKARAETEKYLSDSRIKIDNLIKEIKNASRTTEIPPVKQLFSELYKENEKIFKEDIDISNKKHNFKLGDFAKIRGTSAQGKIVEIDLRKNVYAILSGGIKIQVKVNDLVPAEKKQEPKHNTQNFELNLPVHRIDIRGKRPEEIHNELLQFLDIAYTSNLQTAEILHGKGNGVLSKFVRDILKEHPGVIKFYFAAVEYGGEGITIAEFK